MFWFLFNTDHMPAVYSEVWVCGGGLAELVLFTALFTTTTVVFKVVRGEDFEALKTWLLKKIEHPLT